MIPAYGLGLSVKHGASSCCISNWHTLGSQKNHIHIFTHEKGARTPLCTCSSLLTLTAKRVWDWHWHWLCMSVHQLCSECPWNSRVRGVASTLRGIAYHQVQSPASVLQWLQLSLSLWGMILKWYPRALIEAGKESDLNQTQQKTRCHVFLFAFESPAQSTCRRCPFLFPCTLLHKMRMNVWIAL